MVFSLGFNLYEGFLYCVVFQSSSTEIDSSKVFIFELVSVLIMWALF